MTAIAARAPLRTQTRYLAWRSMMRTLRQPIMIVPTLVFPLFLLAINAERPRARRPTSPASRPTPTSRSPSRSRSCRARSSPRNTAGTNLAEDIGSGFFNRLSLTPMRGSALLAGQLAGVLMVALVQAVTYLLVGLAAGADFEAGILRRPGALRALVRDLRARSARSACSSGCARARARPCRACSR